MEHEVAKYAEEDEGAELPQTDLVIMPVMQAADFLARRKALYDMLWTVMIKDTDYGQIPGTDKPTLYKPGAEKLIQLFGIEIDLKPVEIIEEWAGQEPFLYYKYEATAMRRGRAFFRYSAIAHSRETKYRYRWVPEHAVPRWLDKSELEVRDGTVSEYTFAVDKRETGGKYGKPAEYWEAFVTAIQAGEARKFKKRMGNQQKDAWEIRMISFRIPNPEVSDLAHTISAIAQKRAIVGLTRYVTNASDIFDVSDAVEEGDIVIDAEFTETEATLKGKTTAVPTENKAKGLSKAGGRAGKTKATKPKNGNGESSAIQAIYKAFGEAEGKDVPPEDAELKAFLARMGKLVSADGLTELCETVFSKTVGGLSAAHVTAIMAQDDETIKGVPL